MGLAAVVRDGLTVGARGDRGGAVVVADVAAGETVVDSPTRPLTPREPAESWWRGRSADLRRWLPPPLTGRSTAVTLTRTGTGIRKAPGRVHSSANDLDGER